MMRHIPALLIGTVIGGGLFGSLSRLNAQQPAPVVPPTVGRYTIAPEASGVFLADTSTGKVWYKPIGTGAWDAYGSPEDAGK